MTDIAPPAQATATGFNYPGAELDALAGADNYYRWVLRLLGDRLRGRVVEVGAGTGNFAAHLLTRPEVASLRLVEPADNLRSHLESRFDGDSRIEIRPGYFGDRPPAQPFDAVVLVNVLEHIHDDAGFAQSAWDQLGPGGALLIFVPACPRLFGALDDAFGHYRRYTRDTLRALLETPGFRIEKLGYSNLIGIVPWWFSGKVLRHDTISRRPMKLYDRLIVPWASRVERLVPPPVGQSLVAVATKPVESQ